MANYNGLPGLDATISDGGIPSVSSESSSYSTQAKTEPILIIAPADVAGLRALHTSSAELNLTKINSVSDFGASTKIGTYDVTNKIATAYRKAVDAGADNIYAIALRGANQYEKYLFLHDLFSTLEDSTRFDIVVLDDTADVFADAKIAIGGITLATLTATPASVGLYYVEAGEQVVDGETVAITEGKFANNEKDLYANQAIYVSDINNTIVEDIIVEGASDTFAKTAHGLVNGDYVKASTSTLSEIADDAYLYVVAKTDNTFKLALTEDGVAITIADEVAIEDISVEADTGVFTSNAHGLVNGDYVKASASTLDQIIDDTYFYVVAKTDNTFKLSLTLDGAAITVINEDGTITLTKKNTLTLTRKAPVFKATQFYDRQLFEKDFNSTFSASTPGAKVEFAKQLAGFCKTLSINTNTVLGLIAVQPPVDTNIAGIRTYVKNFEGITYEYNGFVQVITGPKHNFLFNGAGYSDMWTSAYAGMIASRPSYSSPTNKTIPGVLTTTYELSKRQQLTIIQAHGVITKQRGVGDVAIVDAITSAPDNTDFVRLTTVRIMKDVVNVIREIGDPYIGEPNSPEKRNALEASIKNGLNNMIKAGAIQKFTCFINASNIDIISGNMKIFVEFVPQFETRNIKLAIGLKPTL